MSVVDTSDYSLTVKNSSSVSFTLFHAADVGTNAKTTSFPSKELLPNGETCLAWNSDPDSLGRGTSVGHIYYSPLPGPGKDIARVWGVQLNSYTASGGLPKTFYQYTYAVNPYSKTEPGPPFWLESGKGWRESYCFVIPVQSETGKVKITVADDPHGDVYSKTGKPLYSVAILIEDY
ncbi:hypothetical protein DFH07DRAFT_766263 [Mycena maculata]|uniref:Uncharacterized protein n=1 Tax=Mycena maculata TaxID=230809 RepID=A0AAD7K498_9AGAR|nr:hypothetical protein DFH07DRAFT_766263 [Mycena maculata]